MAFKWQFSPEGGRQARTKDIKDIKDPRDSLVLEVL